MVVWAAFNPNNSVPQGGTLLLNILYFFSFKVQIPLDFQSIEKSEGFQLVERKISKFFIVEVNEPKKDKIIVRWAFATTTNLLALPL